MTRVSRLFVFVVFVVPSFLFGQYADQNVNMVSGTQWPGGDPFLRQQNEGSLAVSTRNPLHILAGANDYRTVDINFSTPPRPDSEETGDAWVGVFKSFDGGNRWTSTLLDGYPQLTNTTSPLHGFQAAADPVVRAGNNGMFYYAGIVLNRGTNPASGVFVARFIDNNNTETADPIAYIDTRLLDQGTSGQFIDKPWLAVAPTTNGGQCTVNGQTFAAQNIYLAYSVLVGNDNNVRTKIMFTRSTDCGATWATPIKLSESYSINQGVNIAADPNNNNNVYVAWRRFAGGQDPDSIIIAKSTNAGGAFTKGVVASNISYPFDQGTTSTSIRTNAYPAIAVDNSGRVYLAWSQRAMSATDDGRIVLSSSADGQTGWTTPAQIAPIVGGTSQGRGHQLMPTMLFAAGKLTLAWYDLRDDQTIGGYALPFVNGHYTESRILKGNLFLQPPQLDVVFAQYLSDTSPYPADPTKKLLWRHTLEVYAMESTSLGASPSFTGSVRVTRYKIGSVPQQPPTNPPVYGQIKDLQIDPPNLPMFHGGTVPFFGDYIDMTAYMNPNGNARVRHVVWTDNRDVRAPLGQPPDWTKYTPVLVPGLNGNTSVFDPNQQRLPCSSDVNGNALNAGSRNQNIYTTRVTDGLFAGAPTNAKPLGTIQRAFAVFVQNTQNMTVTYTLTLQPSAGTASFLQFGTQTTTTVNVPAHGSATRTVFVGANTPAGTHIDVLISGGGLNTVVTLGDSGTNSSIATAEVFNPDIGNPDIGNPDIGNPDIGNPDIGNPDIGNPDIGNPDIGNPDIGNPDIGNPDIGNPDIGNPDIGNPDIGNGTMSDTTWTATNQGNTTGGYTVKLYQAAPLPPNVTNTQLIISKIYDTPAARGCTLGVDHNKEVVTWVNNPTPATLAQLIDPSLNDPDAATMTLGPGESAKITIRLIDPVHKNLPPMDASQFLVPVTISHSVNTVDAQNGKTQPPISLMILTTSLHDGMVNSGYSAPLSAVGGTGSKTWTATGLPAGLSVIPTEGGSFAISGIPAQAGDFQVTVTVTDSATPTPHSKSRALALHIAPQLTITTNALPDGTLAGLGVTVADYNFTVQATGGTAPLTWSAVAGLPTRLAFNTSTGTIAGPVSQIVDQDYTFTVTDSSQPPRSVSKVLHLRTAPPLVITTQSIPNAVVSQPYSTPINVTGGQAPYSWSIKGPQALTIDSNGVVSGLFNAPNSSFVTVTVSDSAQPTPRTASQQYDFSAVPIAISAITPSTAAAGFGQMVAIDTNLSSLNNVSVTFSDGTTTEAGFIFPSPSTPQRLFVRLPTDGALTPGTLTVALMQGATQLATGQMTLSTTPGAPVIQYVMGLAVPPTANDCGTLTSTAPIGNISVGQGIAVDGLGIDTTNATLVFSQSGKDSLTVSEACSLSSNSYGMATVFTVPAGLSNGPVSLTLYVTVNGVQSTPSSAFAMNVVNPTYACIGSAFSILNTWNTGATGQPGNAPSFSTNGQTYCLDSIEDYHWNNHNGIAATSIGLTSVCELSCQSIGPFAAVNAGGATDGVAANWLMRPPNQVTINGTFTVVDTDSATWSYDAQNDPNNKTAFSNVMVKSAVVTTPPPIQ